VSNNIVDKMLRDHRHEEQKERSNPAPRINKGYMEDIKEQDSEQESNKT